MPLYIFFCGEHLLCARLRSSNVDASAGSLDEVKRIVKQIRESWPEARIILRADSGFCRDEIMKWCEEAGNKVDYIFGLARNQRLRKLIDAEMVQAAAEHGKTNETARVFTEFVYQTLDSSNCARRVIAKAGHLDKGENPRFIVTSRVSKGWRRNRCMRNSTALGARWRTRLKSSSRFSAIAPARLF